MKLPIEFNDVIEVSDKVDEDGHLEIDLLFDDEIMISAYLTKRQALKLAKHIVEVFKCR
jgi:hypothetical protein